MYVWSGGEGREGKGIISFYEWMCDKETEKKDISSQDTDAKQMKGWKPWVNPSTFGSSKVCSVHVDSVSMRLHSHTCTVLYDDMLCICMRVCQSMCVFSIIKIKSYNTLIKSRFMKADC